MAACCRCNKKGLCKDCICAKSGLICTSCLPSHLSFCANMQIATSNVVYPAVVSSTKNNAPVDSSQTATVSASNDNSLLFDEHVVGYSPDLN